jgi:hypothetical protein
MHPGQGETVSVNHFDMHALAEPCRKIAATETDARQLNPVRLNLYRRRRELYISLGYGRMLLTSAVPETATGYVILGGAVLSHFLAENEIWLVRRRSPGLVTVLVWRSE